MHIKMAIIGYLVLVCPSIYADNIWNKEHKIDVWTNHALKKAGGETPKIIEVYSTSYKKWDNALNSAYKLLMQKLPERDIKLLRDSQRKWIAYKNAEFIFMSGHIQREGGTLSKVITYERMNSFIRARVIELEAYVFIYDTPP